MKNLFLFLCSLFLFASVFASNPEKIWHLNWGDAPSALSPLKAPEGTYGPQAFAVRGDTLMVLDNGQARLKRFFNARLFDQFTIPANAREFAFRSPREIAVIADNRLLANRQGQWQLVYEPTGRKVLAAIEGFTGRGVRFRLTGGETYLMPVNRNSLRKGQSALQSPPQQVRVALKGRFSAAVQVLDESGRLIHELPVDTQPLHLASIRFITDDAQGNYFIHLEFFEQQVPLKIRREVWMLSKTGKLLARVHLFRNNYVQPGRDFYVDQKANVYQMIFTPQGVDVIRWDLSGAPNQPQPFMLDYPEHYNQIQPPEPLPPAEPSDVQGRLFKNEQLQDVTPEEALSIADTYVALYWDCQQKNLTNGIVTDSYGYKVRTPDWLYIGKVHRVPYKWGGFETVQQFKDGIKAGKYAGDNYTSKCCGSSSAVGVDCSGFVSRCWKLSSHYSTSMMDDEITKPYDSWDQVRPGDACHKVGHVRLIVERKSNGSIDMVESAGFNWRVSYTNYYYYQISSYTPRYYVRMAGAPGNIPQVTLNCMLGGDSGYVDWQISSMGAVANFSLYRYFNGRPTRTLLPITSTELKFPVANGEAVYYRLSSVSSLQPDEEGIPSDTYGLYRRDGVPKVLIVDGFDRTSAHSGSWPHPYHFFAATLGRALQANGVPFETVTNDYVLDKKVDLNDYPAVFWVLGDESTEDFTFSFWEQKLVKPYLQNGGKLFVSGSEIGWDLDYKGSTKDKDFYHTFLKAVYKEDDAKSYHVVGAGGTMFQELSLNYDDGTHGVYREDYPDAIEPNDGGSVALRYGNGKVAAVQYKGLFPDGTAEGALFYMAFPFETIYNESQRNELMARVLNYFDFDVTAISSQPTDQTPKQFRLKGNYPNPFNAVTTIQFDTPSTGRLRLQVFNLLGQQVAQREQYIQTAGAHRLKFDAAALSSGVYVYQMTFRGRQTSAARGKFTLIK